MSIIGSTIYFQIKRYAGLSEGSLCWCSDDIGSLLQASEQCNTSCAGDNNQKCGGTALPNSGNATVNAITLGETIKNLEINDPGKKSTKMDPKNFINYYLVR